jgi:hypothetical protein
MQTLHWKQHVLQALHTQYQVELNSGYDVKESLLALSVVEVWVEQNNATTLEVFLTELDDFYEDRKAHWQHRGLYSGALGTLGSCRALIIGVCSPMLCSNKGLF